MLVLCKFWHVGCSEGENSNKGTKQDSAVCLHRRRLWLDILTTLPWEWMVLSATGVSAESIMGRYIALLSLLKLGRMYRVAVLFYNISYNLSVGLLALTLMRNFTVS